VARPSSPESAGNGPEVIVAGYASIDLAFQASAPPVVGRTARLTGPVIVPRRFGGCGPNAARQLARLGCQIRLLTWLGDDADGAAYLRDLAEDGVDTRGVTIARGSSSPRCYLFYDPLGGATCYYHPSDSAQLCLTDATRAMLASARALALTVAPAHLTEGLLDARPPGSGLAWNVKGDPAAYPPPLRRRLVREADVICLNRDELPFVASALRSTPPENDDEALATLRGEGNAVVVVTAGAAGCTVVWPTGNGTVPGDPVAVHDSTGAGDTFFGAFVAGWLSGLDPVSSARSASREVASLLRQRAAREDPS